MAIVDIDRFRAIPEKMLWRTAAMDQIDTFERVATALAANHGATAAVVGSHRSKSIDLPVIKFSTPTGEFTLRDNFHDVNLMAILKRRSELSLQRFFSNIQEPLTWEWYLSEIDRARGYSWRQWSDSEMNDPRILRVRDKRPGCGDMWWSKTQDEKDRWAARMDSPAWYSHDWARCELTWDGDFGPGVSLYQQDHAFAEGISVTTKNRYRKGVDGFIIATTLWKALCIIERLHEAERI